VFPNIPKIEPPPIINRNYEIDRFNPIEKIEGSISSNELNTFFKDLRNMNDDDKLDHLTRIAELNKIDKIKFKRLYKFYNNVFPVKVDHQFYGLWKKPSKNVYSNKKIELSY
jgi:hypothetical protein